MAIKMQNKTIKLCDAKFEQVKFLLPITTPQQIVASQFEMMCQFACKMPIGDFRQLIIFEACNPLTLSVAFLRHLF